MSLCLYPQVLLMAMKDMNIAKLSSGDLPLFAGIIQDLFPAVETPVIDYGKVNEQLRSALLNQGVHCSVWLCWIYQPIDLMTLYPHPYVLVMTKSGMYLCVQCSLDIISIVLSNIETQQSKAMFKYNQSCHICARLRVNWCLNIEIWKTDKCQLNHFSWSKVKQYGNSVVSSMDLNPHWSRGLLFKMGKTWTYFSKFKPGVSITVDLLCPFLAAEGSYRGGASSERVAGHSVLRDQSHPALWD